MILIKVQKVAKQLKFIVVLVLTIIINVFMKKIHVKKNNWPNAKITNPDKMENIVHLLVILIKNVYLKIINAKQIIQIVQEIMVKQLLKMYVKL